MHNRSYDPTFEYLIRGFLTLNSVDECRAFLYDLCTESELQEMSRRLQTARLLRCGHIYADIAEVTGLSTATISRVNRCLKFGEGGGYLTVIDRLEKEARR